MSKNFEVWEEPRESNLEKDCLFCVYEEDPERKVEPYEYPCSECKGHDMFEKYEPDKIKVQRRESVWLKYGNKSTCQNCDFTFWCGGNEFKYCPDYGAKMKGCVIE